MLILYFYMSTYLMLMLACVFLFTYDTALKLLLEEDIISTSLNNFKKDTQTNR